MKKKLRDINISMLFFAFATIFIAMFALYFQITDGLIINGTYLQEDSGTFNDINYILSGETAYFSGIIVGIAILIMIVAFIFIIMSFNKRKTRLAMFGSTLCSLISTIILILSVIGGGKYYIAYQLESFHTSYYLLNEFYLDQMYYLLVIPSAIGGLITSILGIVYLRLYKKNNLETDENIIFSKGI